MNSQPYIVILFFSTVIMVSALVSSCGNGSGLSDTPAISFIELSKDTIVQSNLLGDSVFLKISFSDGDGDLGSGNRDISENIILTDSRTGEVFGQYIVPPLPTAGAQTGIEGTITMKIYSTCCLFPDGTPPCLTPVEFPTDELFLDIQMKDDSGNLSNIVQSTRLTLLCN